VRVGYVYANDDDVGLDVSFQKDDIYAAAAA